jgi:hypothetical protein
MLCSHTYFLIIIYYFSHLTYVPILIVYNFYSILKNQPDCTKSNQFVLYEFGLVQIL